MTAAERALVARFRRKLAELMPDLAAALTDAWSTIGDDIDTVELARLISTGDINHIVAQIFSDAALDAALSRVRFQIRLQVEKAVIWAASDLPKRGGAVRGRSGIAFDVLNEKHIEAIRGLTTRVMQTLKGDVRESVRAFIETGLRAGANPRDTARHIQEILGLAPNQLKAVENFRAALEAGDIAKALRYQLRDKRFSLRTELTPARIDKMVAAYHERFVAFHAETVSRTATLDSLKLGQKLSFDEAISKGIVDGNRLQKTWVTVGDDRVRPEHVAMDGETVPHDSYYSNGEMVPGESTYNCRCISRFSERRDSQRTAA